MFSSFCIVSCFSGRGGPIIVMVSNSMVNINIKEPTFEAGNRSLVSPLGNIPIYQCVFALTMTMTMLEKYKHWLYCCSWSIHLELRLWITVERTVVK